MSLVWFQALSTFFVEIIYLFTSWHLPGTNVTPLGFALFFVMAAVGIRVLKHLVGVGGSPFDSFRTLRGGIDKHND